MLEEEEGPFVWILSPVVNEVLEYVEEAERGAGDVLIEPEMSLK